jgi:hypothetical protein
LVIPDLPYQFLFQLFKNYFFLIIMYVVEYLHFVIYNFTYLSFNVLQKNTSSICSDNEQSNII